MTNPANSHPPMTPQQLAMIAEVAEAYAIAFSIEEPVKRELLSALLVSLVERGADTKAELVVALEDEIARGFFR